MMFLRYAESVVAAGRARAPPRSQSGFVNFMKSKAMAFGRAQTLHTAPSGTFTARNLAGQITAMLSPPSDAEPLLGGRVADLADDEDTDIDTAEPLIARVRRVFSLRRMLRLGEVAGSLGDLGTFLPDLVSLSNNPHGAYPVPASFVFFSGAWSLITGCSYDMPLPVQPMHTVVAVALTEGLTYAETVAAGIWLGAAFLVLGATGLVSSLTLNPSPSPTP